MNGLLEFLYKHNHWLLFILLEGISLVLLFTFNEFQNSIYLSSANTVSGSLFEAKENITSYFDLRGENERLTEQNARLQEDIYALRQRLDSASLAELSARTVGHWPFDVTPATVVQNSLDKMNNYLTINKGEADGIAPDMGVISSDGVVGVVYKCSKHFSLVIPILNTVSNISCKVMPSESFGYLEWEGGDARYSMLRNVPRYAQISIGDTIITSGHSSFFPEGLSVGTISSFEPSVDNLSNNITVQLSTEFNHLQHVFIIKNPDTAERKQLLESLNSKKK